VLKWSLFGRLRTIQIAQGSGFSGAFSVDRMQSLDETTRETAIRMKRASVRVLSWIKELGISLV
jgi:hypothetical protein